MTLADIIKSNLTKKLNKEFDAVGGWANWAVNVKAQSMSVTAEINGTSVEFVSNADGDTTVYLLDTRDAHREAFFDYAAREVFVDPINVIDSLYKNHMTFHSGGRA